MQDTLSAGSAGNDGSQNVKALPRLRPFEIAVRVLPVVSVTVLAASDEQFQAFVDAHRLHIDEAEIGSEWSFDDRCRLINHWRKYGIDLFVLPNKNNSEAELFEPA